MKSDPHRGAFEGDRRRNAFPLPLKCQTNSRQDRSDISLFGYWRKRNLLIQNIGVADSRITRTCFQRCNVLHHGIKLSRKKEKIRLYYSRIRAKNAESS